MAHNSPELIGSIINKIDSEKFDKEIFDKAGLFIVRKAIPEKFIKEWKEEWDSFYIKNLAAGRNVNINNPVDLKEPLPEKLANIYKNEIILNFAEQVFGKNVALLNHRFVIKDKFSPGEIFIHHDFCYHIGNPNKASFFVPLSYAGKKNGGLTFYLGTHKYGYLGDAGEIDPDAFNERWPQVTPELEPGDFAIMNSLLWHKSGINEIGIDRIVADIIFQPADDPSGKELVRGEWQTDIFIQHSNLINYFKTSRVKKIKELSQKQVKS
jgi:ectoine hydroxylase-related dioxygenase (phytanoyl-CoA dioxygenase family)